MHSPLTALLSLHGGSQQHAAPTERDEGTVRGWEWSAIYRLWSLRLSPVVAASCLWPRLTTVKVTAPAIFLQQAALNKMGMQLQTVEGNGSSIVTEPTTVVVDFEVDSDLRFILAVARTERAFDRNFFGIRATMSSTTAFVCGRNVFVHGIMIGTFACPLCRPSALPITTRNRMPCSRR